MSENINMLFNTITARRAWIKCLYNNKDISSSLEPYLKSFTYNDVISGQADDISLTLEDIENLWSNDWLPEKGAILTISIVTQAWWKDNVSIEELPLGTFEIDEVEYSGPPTEVKIKGVSVPDNTELRGTEKSRAWEKVNLSTIARDIASNAGMEIFYDTEEIYLERAEQSQESDLEFLLKLCNDNGLALKISNNQIVIFDEADYEAKEAVDELELKNDLIRSYSIKTKTREVYKQCHVKYKNTKENTLIEYTFLPEVNKDKNGKTLEINEEVKTTAEAERLAKKKLREKNKEEQTVSMTVYVSFFCCAGNCFTLKNFGKFDGKYILTKATHNVGSGYTCNLELRKVLEGY